MIKIDDKILKEIGWIKPKKMFAAVAFAHIWRLHQMKKIEINVKSKEDLIKEILKLNLKNIRLARLAKEIGRELEAYKPVLAEILAEIDEINEVRLK